MNDADVGAHVSAAARVRFCCRKPDAGDAISWQCQPFTVAVDGVRYVAATDGHRLCAVVSNEVTADIDKPRTGIGSLIATRGESIGLVTKNAIAEWVPEACTSCGGRGQVTCDNCGGEPTWSCECHWRAKDVGQICATCDECEGAGVVDCPRRCGSAWVVTGQVGPARINRRLLLGAAESSGAGAIEVFTDGAIGAVRFEAPGWIMLVMPVVGDGSVTSTLALKPRAA